MAFASCCYLLTISNIPLPDIVKVLFYVCLNTWYVGIIVKVVNDGGLEWVYALFQTDQSLLIGEGLIAINIVASIPDGV